MARNPLRLLRHLVGPQCGVELNAVAAIDLPKSGVIGC